MPDIALDFRTVQYVTDLGIAVSAMRAFVGVEFPTQTGTTVDYDCFVDIGAPFSVLPYSLWHDRRVQWRKLGSILTLVGSSPRPVPDALEWQGAPCDLGETEVYLIDTVSRVQTGPHRVVGKFVRQRMRSDLEFAAILGVNFEIDNNIQLVLPGPAGGASGHLSVP